VHVPNGGHAAIVHRRSGTGVVVKYLAKSAPDAVTGKTRTDAVERYLFFHNGRELRAADVKYSFERAARGKRPWVFDKITGAREVIAGRATDMAGLRVIDDLGHGSMLLAITRSVHSARPARVRRQRRRRAARRA